MVLENVDIYANGKILLRQPRITMVIIGNITIRQDCSLKKYYENKDSQINKKWNTYFNWDAEASKRLENSKIASPRKIH